MPVEAKDLIGWGVTGGLGALGLILNWQTRRDVKRREREQTESVWSLRVTDYPTLPGDIGLELRLRDAAAQRLRLQRITVIAPSDAEIAEAEWRTSGPGEDSLYAPGTFGRSVTIDRDLDPTTIAVPYGGVRSTSFTVMFFARRPRRSDRPVKIERLTVRLDLEGITARAAHKTITVKSEPVDWARAHAIEDQVL